MELYQIKYLLAVATYGSFSLAAEKLFISQSSISSAVLSLEKEFNLEIFERTYKGAILTREGEELLSDLFKLSKHIDLLQDKYTAYNVNKKRLAISSQHHVGAIDPLLELINAIEEPINYRFYEESTDIIIDNIKSGYSDIGVIFINEKTKKVLIRELNKKQLIFDNLIDKKPHIYLNKNNPLSKKDYIYYNDLEELTLITYDTNIYNSSIYTSIVSKNKEISTLQINDRAVAYSILDSSNNHYILGSGILSKSEINNGIVALPIMDSDLISVGYIYNNCIKQSELIKRYIIEYKKIL